MKMALVLLKTLIWQELFIFKEYNLDNNHAKWNTSRHF
jgi:hypothetical protein